VRTTVTLDPDVEARLRSLMRQRGLSFKQALNETLRRALSAKASPSRRFTQKTYSLGAEPLFPWDKALAAAAAIEDEELARKISLRK
jgi:hypothetical protein